MKIELVVTFRNKKYKLSDEIDEENPARIDMASKDISKFLSIFMKPPKFEIIEKKGSYYLSRLRGEKN